MNSKLDNIKWMPVNNGSEEMRKLMKLNVTKEKLVALLESINKEINQTELEWLQLKNILNPKPRPASVNKPTPEMEIDPRDIDDEAVNNIDLDLSVTTPRQPRAFAEDDDDDI